MMKSGQLWHFKKEEPWQVKKMKEGWRSDPMTLGVFALMIGAGVGGAALGGAFGKKEDKPASAYAPPSTDTGKVTDVGSVETQAAQRRLARLSKYFTSPTGVLDTTTGQAGVF